MEACSPTKTLRPEATHVLPNVIRETSVLVSYTHSWMGSILARSIPPSSGSRAIQDPAPQTSFLRNVVLHPR